MKLTWQLFRAALWRTVSPRCLATIQVRRSAAMTLGSPGQSEGGRDTWNTKVN